MFGQRQYGACGATTDPVACRVGRAVSTIHLGKGLEFRVVAVTACNDEVIPLQTGIEYTGMTRIWRRSTASSGTCSTLPALARATVHRGRAYTRARSSLKTFKRGSDRLVGVRVQRVRVSVRVSNRSWAAAKVRFSAVSC